MTAKFNKIEMMLTLNGYFTLLWWKLGYTQLVSTKVGASLNFFVAYNLCSKTIEKLVHDKRRKDGVGI